MTGFNLPPGCRVSDIPGNTPADEAEEAFWGKFEDKCKEAGIDIDTLIETPRYFFGSPDIQGEDDAIYEIVKIARDVGYSAGYEAGHADKGYEDAIEEAKQATNYYFLITGMHGRYEKVDKYFDLASAKRRAAEIKSDYALINVEDAETGAWVETIMIRGEENNGPDRNA